MYKVIAGRGLGGGQCFFSCLKNRRRLVLGGDLLTGDRRSEFFFCGGMGGSG